MQKIKTFIAGHLELSLIIGLLAGLFLPGLETLPKESSILLVAFVIFFSCSKIIWADFGKINFGQFTIFYMARFVLLPVVLYWLANVLIPDYAIAILLVALMPVGVASTTIANLTGGNALMALSGTILTNALAPLGVSLIFWLVMKESIEINTLNMFMALSCSIFLPAIIYFLGLMPFPTLKKQVDDYSAFFSVIGLGAMVAVAVALQRDYFLENWLQIIPIILAGCILYGFFFVFGWFYAWRKNKKEKISNSLLSGVNNISLAIGIAALYFPQETLLFVVAMEVPWIVTVSLFKKFAERNKL